MSSRSRPRASIRVVWNTETEIARALADYQPPDKAQQRAEAAAAVDAYFASNGRVKRLPTVLHLHCPKCRHRGSVRLPPGKTMPRFRCKRCGTRL